MMAACLRRNIRPRATGNTEGGTTYHEVAVAVAMKLVCDVDGAAAVFGHGHFALALGLEVPDGVGVFWVLEQLVDSHGRHGRCWAGGVVAG